MNKIIPTLLVSCLAALPVFAEMVHIPADRDNSLIEDPDGAVSNGMGPNFRAGRTNQSMYSVRRGLLRFDVASAVPAEARNNMPTTEAICDGEKPRVASSLAITAPQERCT